MKTLTVREAIVGLIALLALFLGIGSILTLIVGAVLFIWNVGNGESMVVYYRVGATVVVGIIVSIIMLGIAVLIVKK